MTRFVRRPLPAALAGVVANPAQNNPWQPDIAFRGFTASPLMGAPQGLSVFLDGVRVNEAFGDTVIGRVNNLFDRRYDAHAVLGRNFFPAGGFDAPAAANEQFRSPGSPRGVWLGVRYAWSGG